MFKVEQYRTVMEYDAVLRAHCRLEEQIMTADDFRRLALSLPGALEGAHMGNADFRAGGGIFATLSLQREGYGVLKLTPEQQQGMIEDAPELFSPVPGGWGRIGATRVRLETVSEDVLADALRTAWQNRLAKSKRADGQKAKARGLD